MSFFYIKFTLNDKIESKADLLAVSNAIPFLADIPDFKADKIFTDFNDRSILAESFRILATNINYMIPKGKKNSGSVIYVTSGKMDEGKSLIAYNLSVAYASINKRVLLVGDAPYYGRFGFAKLEGVVMPPPTNPDRVLGLELVPGAWVGVTGDVRRALG